MVRRRAPRIWELTWASADSARHTALHSRTDYFFRAGSWDYINIRPSHSAQFLSTYRSVRPQFVHLHGKPHRFCTSDRPLGITHGRKTVSPSRNPCGSDPFLVAIHNRCPPSWDPHRLFIFWAEARTESHMGDISRLLFISTAEHRLAADRSKQIFMYALSSMRGHLRC